MGCHHQVFGYEPRIEFRKTFTTKISKHRFHSKSTKFFENTESLENPHFNESYATRCIKHRFYIQLKCTNKDPLAKELSRMPYLEDSITLLE
jgi:hypothetical protein